MILGGVPHLKLFSDSVVCCDGNSLTAGSGADYPTNAYPAQLSRASVLSGLGITAINVGVGGQSTQHMIATPGDVQAAYAAGKMNVLIAWELRNDMWYGTSAAQAVANMWTYCDARKAEGWKILVVGTLPNWSANQSGSLDVFAFNAALIAADALLAAGWRGHAHGYVSLRDGTIFGTYPMMQAAFDSHDYFYDYVHCNTTGYYVVVGCINAALLKLRAR